jgi:hypothetical protein
MILIFLRPACHFCFITKVMWERYVRHTISDPERSGLKRRRCLLIRPYMHPIDPACLCTFQPTN